MNLCHITPPEQTCCFTGHRRIQPSQVEELNKRLSSVIDTLYKEGVRHFRCGGALGFDSLAALAVIRSKRERSDIRLILILPCIDQTHGWSRVDERIYERIRESADEIVYTATEYSRQNMLLRDRALVDGCGICVAYMNSTSGGTAYTVGYAVRSGLRVLNLGKSAIPTFTTK